MTAEIIIEQYDNGITLRSVGRAIVVLDREKERSIGKMIWKDVKFVMDTELCNVVTINIEYGTGNTNQSLEADSVNGLLGRE